MAMPTIESSNSELLNAVQQMAPEEFDAFIEQVLLLRAQSKVVTLSAEETRLMERINRGLPEELSKRYAQLIRKRKKVRLTSREHQELLELTNQAESRDADRAAALLQLAKLRQMPLRALMKQLGIQAPLIDG
jgi:hypothetical protein